MKLLTRVILLVFVVMLLGCATRIPEGVHVKLPSECANHMHDQSSVHIRYLGAAGLIFEYGTNTVLTAPFFSNFGFIRSGLAPISPKRAVIDRLLPDLDAVDAVLVGHSHYDHLIDLPYILNSGRTQAPVYGNISMVSLLTNKVPNRLIDVESTAGDFQTGAAAKDWCWTSNKAIRFMALKSMHAPHWRCVTLFNGQVCRPRKCFPLTAWGWKCGTPLAFVIDFMKDDGKTVAYRVVFNDSAVDGFRFGHLPRALLDEHKVDLAVMCMASFSQVKGYPEEYLHSLHPDRIMVVHWEDFFRPQTKSPKVVRMSNMRQFLKRLPTEYQSDPFVLHAPGSCESFSLGALQPH